MLIGASLLRIAFGFIIIYNYAIHYSQRHFLWGANGVVGYSPYESLSVYSLNTSPLAFDILFHIGTLVAVAFTVGFKTRLTAILNFIFVWSLMEINGLVLDGGSNISRILLFYLIFATTAAYFSVDSHLKENKESKTVDRNAFSLRVLVHNLAILACLAQVCIMYFTSGLHKAMGGLWQNGTAIYYILQVEEFTHPFFANLVLSSDLLLVIGAYFTIVVQLAYPFLLTNRYTRYAAMAGVISMHLGIAVVMGLFTFSFIMIANQMLFLKDNEYKSLFKFVKEKRAKFTKNKQTALTGRGKTDADLTAGAQISPIIVLYDGWCPFCNKSIQTFKKLDWRDRVSFTSFREPGIAKQFGVEVASLEKRIHSVQRSTNTVEEGINSINRICKNVPLLWFLVPMLSFSSMIGLGQPVYDWIAKRRTIFPTGGCEEDSCEMPLSKKNQ